MTWVWIFLTAAICGCWTLPSAAQSSVSGRYLLEPVVGRFIADEGRGVTLFGARATWRRTYARTYVAEILYGRRGSTTDVFVSPGSEPESSQTQVSRHILASLGVGSTIIDRDATGNVGAHVLFGLGLLSSRHVERSEHRTQDQPPERYEIVRARGGPMASFSLIGEAELVSPRLVLRVQPSGYLSLNVIPQNYLNTTWMFGASVTAGLAFAL